MADDHITLIRGWLTLSPPGKDGWAHVWEYHSTLREAIAEYRLQRRGGIRLKIRRVS